MEVWEGIAGASDASGRCSIANVPNPNQRLPAVRLALQPPRTTSQRLTEDYKIR